jgi:hypothetical protein
MILATSKNEKKVPEVLTLNQLAKFLHIRWGTAKKLLEDGEIPARRLADQENSWRILRDDALAWVRGRGGPELKAVSQ